MCLWILDFLLNRPQVVKIGGNLSSSLILSTGAPQGCVLSPMLYSLFTHDCASCHKSTQILKSPDDTTVQGIITNSDESEYRDQVNKLINWCDENNLELNVSKTKEMIVDFRRKKPPISPLLIDGKTVEIVQHVKFLGSTISSDLKWELNVDTIVKKAQQRLYFLRRLRSFGLTTQITLNFYKAVIESVLTFSITVWFGSITVKYCFQNNRQMPSQSRITVTAVFELRRDFATFSRLFFKCRICLETARHRCRMIILNIVHFDQWSDTCYIMKYKFFSRLFSV